MKKSLSLVAVAVALFAGCSTSPAAETIRLGYIGPLTGDIAGLGKDTLNGMQMAAEEINAAGGINGKQIEIVAEDGRCSGAEAANAARKLVNVDKVVAIVGAQCSSETLAAAPIAEAAKVVMISPVSSSPDVTKAGEYIFRTYPSDALKGKAFGAFFKQAGFKKIAIISENTDFCQGIRNSVAENLPEGTTIVFNEVVDPGTKDYRSLFTRLKSVDFDLFLSNGQSDSTVAEMAKQMRELGMKQQIVGTDTADSATLGKIATEAVEGLKALSVPSLSATDANAGGFVTAFNAKYGEPQFGAFFAATAYDATNILAKTIGAQGTDGEKIKAALYAMPEHKGMAGSISFDSNGDVQGVPFAMKQFKAGVLEQSELIPLQ
jgi:branched-chain amino acid transport system substrate-binding protein